jgi:hypothetical protein
LIGPAIVTIVHNPNDVIAEIQVRSAFFQFGKIPKYFRVIGISTSDATIFRPKIGRLLQTGNISLGSSKPNSSDFG